MSSTRIFKIDIFPHEWLTQTAHMTIEQRGVFIQICMMIYARRGPIQNDHHHIARATNCSPRMASKIINELLKNGDIQLVQNPVDKLWMITQKRCEQILADKISHLESSSKGGRKSHENRPESSQYNLLASSSTPTPTLSSEPPSFSVTPREEVLKNGKVKEFRIREIISGNGIEMAKRAAFGWDVYALMPTYDEAVKKMGKPDNPDAAFAGWCKHYTKGKPPA